LLAAHLLNIVQARGKSRVIDLVKLLPRNFAPRSFLDIGCGDGTITMQLQEHYALDAQHTHGCDIVPLAQEQNSFTFHLTEPNAALSKLPTASQSLVVALMALHHMVSWRVCSLSVAGKSRKFIERNSSRA
jgi:16S rRNA G1207 methylase RsmC